MFSSIVRGVRPSLRGAKPRTELGGGRVWSHDDSFFGEEEVLWKPSGFSTVNLDSVWRLSFFLGLRVQRVWKPRQFYPVKVELVIWPLPPFSAFRYCFTRQATRGAIQRHGAMLTYPRYDTVRANTVRLWPACKGATGYRSIPSRAYHSPPVNSLPYPTPSDCPYCSPEVVRDTLGAWGRHGYQLWLTSSTRHAKYVNLVNYYRQTSL